MYVDNDPLVLVHARALLTSTPQERIAYVDADLHEPDRIVRAAAETLDFTQPIGLMLMSVMGHVRGDENGTLDRDQVAGCPAVGQLSAFNDGTNTNKANVEALRGYAESGTVPYHLRSPEQIARFSKVWNWWSLAWCRFRGGDPTPPPSPPTEDGSLCAVGRKP